MPFLKALTIAGSDSSAGAGIQADLKTFAALGIYGTSAVTAVTAQNARRIDALTCLPVSLVVSQILSVLSDMGAQAVKTGMLGTPEIIQGVASALSRFPGIPLVVDPVMASTSGAVLLQEGSLEVLRRRLLPLARIVTPNLPEAAALVGSPLQDESDCIRATREIHAMGPRWVVLKGGHRPVSRVRSGGRQGSDRPGLRRQGAAQGQRTLSPGRSQTGHRVHPFGGHCGLPGQGALGAGGGAGGPGVFEPDLAAFRRAGPNQRSASPFL